MSRTAAGIERVLVILVGLLLIAVGAAAVAWQQGWIPHAIDAIDTSAVSDRTSEPWWPWAVGVVGLLAVIAGIGQLTAHAKRHNVSGLRLDGSGPSGRLTVDAAALIEMTHAAFEDVPGLRARGGRVRHDQRQLVVEVRATVSATVDLAEVNNAAEEAARAAHNYLGEQTPARFRTVLVSTRRRRGTKPRVK